MKIRLRLLVFFLLLILFSAGYAQQIKWNTAPSTGFVFEITNKEAQKLLTVSSPDTIFNGLLHTMVDTFNVKKGWINKPEKGHFIEVIIVGNKLHCQYTSVFPYQVFLLKGYDALSLQVVDREGNVREDARVKLGWRRIAFDKQSKTYRVENDAFRGGEKFVTVEQEGFRSVFNIEKHEAPTWHGNYYSNYDNGPDFYSYMITDKNKYKPGERIRFKSYALAHSRSPLNRALEARLYVGNKVIKVATIEPHRPGSFAGEFYLHDSLKLTLDRSYSLHLVEKRGRVVATSNFRYEDYELNGNKLDIKLTDAKQYHPAKNVLTITATDVNGLPLKDVKANVLVKTQSIRESFQPLVILRDTLMFKQIVLDPMQPTEVDIASALFEKTNTAYEVHVTILNTQNQRQERTVSAVHYYSQYELASRFSNDSIVYEMTDNGKLISDVPFVLKYNDEATGKQVMLPYKEKINPTVASVNLKGDKISRLIPMSSMLPKLELLGGIRNDSFNIQLVNPQKREVSWYVYQGNQLLEKGAGQELDFKSVITDRSMTYYVELLYAFGGQDYLKRKDFEFKEEFLNVDFNMPDRVYPGQTVDALIRVTDQLGYPVKNVDLTVWSVNGKMNYSVPDLPYYGGRSAPRSKSATYSKYDKNKRTAILPLDYARWEKLARLDTMRYYQFTYPKSSFIHKTQCTDSTQFAAYVMQDGSAKQIYVIEIDRRPVYFSWTDQPKHYSFYVSDKKNHLISLRLFDRVLIFDSLRFVAGKKTILSVDLDHLPVNVTTVNMFTPAKRKRDRYRVFPRFTSTEINRYINYVSKVQHPGGTSFLEGDNEFIPLSRTASPQLVLAGPIFRERKTFVNGLHHIRTTHRHSGGYGYSYEDNIVYRTDVKNLLPERLTNTSYNPMERINDRVMTKELFLRDVPVDNRWLTRSIHLQDYSLRVNVTLPEDKVASGVAGFFFQDVKTKEILSPCQDIYTSKRDFFTIPRGKYHAIAVYNNGKYLKMDSVMLKSHSSVYIDLNESKLVEADTASLEWLRRNSNNCFKHEPKQPVITRTLNYSTYTGGNVRGIIYDDANGAVPGANIVIKGTTIGTVADIDGRFEIDVDGTSTTLVISFIGYQTQEIEVKPGADLSIYLMVDVMQLSEVVVVGYGVQSRMDLTGSLSGIVSGVSISYPERETTAADDKSAKENEVKEAEDRLYKELLTLKTIRSNFTDVGFWEPKLFTDKKGESRFTITFPDDITRWDATVYAMNRRLQTGTFRKRIQSYKPLMAELLTPRFLTRGDSALFIGKVLNYTGQKNITGKAQWTGAQTDFEKAIQFTDYHADLLPVNVTSADSITTRYSFTREDGYFDGEERKVSVVEQGTIRANGTLSVFDNKESVHVKANDNEKVIVELMDSPLDIYASDAKYLVDYKYACNEQLASKLLGLIGYEQIMRYQGKEFRYEKEVNKMIERLLKNQNQEFLWSWWEVSSSTSFWMSAHILRALKVAKDAGYVVNLDVSNIVRKAEYKYVYLNNYDLYDIDLINALAAWDAKLDYAKYINKLEKMVWLNEEAMRNNKPYFKVSRLTERLLLMETRQLIGMPFNADSLLHYKKEGIMGDVSFAEKKPASYWYYNELTNNVIAYRIIKRDSVLKKMKLPMQLYFMNHRKQGAWNTYHSASVLTTVLPDLLNAGATKQAKATVQLSGKINTVVTQFPSKTELYAGEELTLKKESGIPLYLMQYTQERVTAAKTGVEGFAIKTRWSDADNVLEAGKPVTLSVEVDVTKDASAEYVMIEVPIPGACSYADKSQTNNRVETHREYFKERTLIFCERMATGKYFFSIQLLPRFTGKYLVNPAQVSLMYAPVVNANTEMKTVRVK